jgi:hypothetical protein
MPATGQQPAGTGIVLPSTPVVVLLGGPAGARRACRVEAPARLLRLWCVLNAADHELHQVKLPPQAAPQLQHLLETVRADLERSVSPALAGELHHLTNWPAGPHGLDELRVESVSLLAWTGELVLAMLAQLQAAQLRQHTENTDQLAAPPAASSRTAQR